MSKEEIIVNVEIDTSGLKESLNDIKSILDDLVEVINKGLKKVDFFDITTTILDLQLSFLALVVSIMTANIGLISLGITLGVYAGIILLIIGLLLIMFNWDRLIAAATNLLSNFWNWLQIAISNGVRWFGGFAQEIMNTFSSAIDFLISVFNTVFSWINNEFILPVQLLFSNMWNGIVQGAIGAWDGIRNAFASVTNWFRDVFTVAWAAVRNVFSTGGQVFVGIVDGILGGFRTIVNAIINGINSVITNPFNAINNMLRIMRGVSILGVTPFGWINTFRVPQIPRLAQGMVIPPNAEFLAVLGDQKRGRNIEAPEALLREILREEGLAGKEIVIVNKLYLDGKEVAEVVNRQNGKLRFTRNGGTQ